MSNPLAETLREKVFSNLDSAKENGQEFPLSAEDEAYELSCYASDLEDTDPAELVPHVQAWMERERRK